MDSVKQIAIGSDHAGFCLKEYLRKHLEQSGYSFRDFGTFSAEPVDYPDIAHPVARAVQSGEINFGILICGSGNGMAIVANKYKGIRAAVCWSGEITALSRQHNDANILVLPARFIGQEEAVKFTSLFLATGFEGGRHLPRVQKI